MHGVLRESNGGDDSNILWAASSAGRAPRSQRGGREIEPPDVHNTFSEAKPSILNAIRLIAADGPGCGLWRFVRFLAIVVHVVFTPDELDREALRS